MAQFSFWDLQSLSKRQNPDSSYPWDLWMIDWVLAKQLDWVLDKSWYIFSLKILDLSYPWPWGLWMIDWVREKQLDWVSETNKHIFLATSWHLLSLSKRQIPDSSYPWDLWMIDWVLDKSWHIFRFKISDSSYPWGLWMIDWVLEKPSRLGCWNKLVYFSGLQIQPK